MVTIHLTGKVTDTGELKVDLPPDFPPGEVQVTIEVLPPELESSVQDVDDAPWTEEELAAFNNQKPMTGAEIVAWMKETNNWWEDDGTSSVEWIENMRRKEREKRGW